MHSHVGHCEYRASPSNVRVDEPGQAVVHSERFAISAGHDGEIVGGIADQRLSPVDHSDPATLVQRAQQILAKQVAVQQ